MAEVTVGKAVGYRIFITLTLPEATALKQIVQNPQMQSEPKEHTDVREAIFTALQNEGI
jgi:hypothetical protein